MVQNRFNLAPKQNRPSLRRVPTGRIVLVVSIVWFAATLLIFLHLDGRVNTGHFGYNEHSNVEFPDLIGAFRDLSEDLSLTNPSDRLAVLNEIVSLMETGINRTEEILKLIDTEIDRIYKNNMEVLKTEKGRDLEQELIVYNKMQRLHKRLQNIIQHNDFPSGFVEEINPPVKALVEEHKQVSKIIQHLLSLSMAGIFVAGRTTKICKRK